MLRPSITEPVPDDLAAAMMDAGLDGYLGLDKIEPLLEAVSCRELDLGYMVGAPRVHLWRQLANGDVIVLRLRSRTDSPSTLFQAAVSTEEFIRALDAFNQQFLAAMSERIAMLEAGTALAPGVSADPVAIRGEHDRRACAYGALVIPPSDWDGVRASLRFLETGCERLT